MCKTFDFGCCVSGSLHIIFKRKDSKIVEIQIIFQWIDIELVSKKQCRLPEVEMSVYEK